MHDNVIHCWFDIDNTLYSSNLGVAKMMYERIQTYFRNLGLSEHDARDLHHRYFTEYGLAIRGLTRHHQIDPLHFNNACDASLPLEEVLKPDDNLSRLLAHIDRSRVHVWCLTNAYHTHANRVLKLLNLDQQFEGVISCDYEDNNFTCKPEREFYEKALASAGGARPENCYFVDDSLLNVRGAKALGWYSCVLLRENPSPNDPQTLDGVDHIIQSLEELRYVWPEVFAPAN